MIQGYHCLLDFQLFSGDIRFCTFPHSGFNTSILHAMVVCYVTILLYIISHFLQETLV